MLSHILPIILVGGKSSRMGINKAFLKFNKHYFLDYIINILYNIGFNKVYVSCNYKNYKEYIKYNFIIDYNNYFNLGPIGAISSILFGKYYKYYTHILFIPVDMPFLNKNLLLNLIMHCEKFVTVIYNMYNFPLLLCISNFVKTIIYNLYLHKYHYLYSINNLLCNINVRSLEFNSIYNLSFSNINTPLEFKEIFFYNS